MKRIFTLLVLSVLTSGMFAQLSIDPGTLDLNIMETEVHTYVINISNPDNVNFEIFWKVIKSDDFPEEWGTTLCDANTCYLENFDICPSNKPNDLKANSSTTFTLKIDPKGVKGEGGLVLELYDDSDLTRKIAETATDGLVVAGAPNSVFGADQLDMIIYPNPSTSFFAIQNDKRVAAVSIYNILGREIASFTHTDGIRHDVSDLVDGMYLVRMIDQKGQVLKSSRLHKR